MNVLKFICHCCKKSSVPELMVPCRISECDLFFCHRCLTSRYKYSYAKTAKLPTSHWRCPVCTQKCRCADCSKVLRPELSASSDKLLIEDAAFMNPRRKKAKSRKGKSKPPEGSVKTGYSTKSFLFEKETQEVCTPTSQFSLPPISGNIYLSSLAFLNIEKKEPVINSAGRQATIFSIDVYEKMQVEELFNLVLFPTVCS